MVDNRYYLSCSDDGTFRVWDAINREQAAWISLDFTASLKRRVPPTGEKFLPDTCKGNTITAAPSGEVIIGCKDGTIRVYDKNYKPRLVQAPSTKIKV